MNNVETYRDPKWLKVKLPDAKTVKLAELHDTTPVPYAHWLGLWRNNKKLRAASPDGVRRFRVAPLANRLEQVQEIVRRSMPPDGCFGVAFGKHLACEWCEKQDQCRAKLYPAMEVE